ncbi:MAG: hypothetical protein MN733_12030 [Nitrososphaera sp.]|nr:hypothetical protein [Nitrososphaera sp.]
MSDLQDIFLGEDLGSSPMGEDSLAKISRLVKDAKTMTVAVAKAEDNLAKAKKLLRKLLDLDIPSAMSEAGNLTSIKIADTKIDVKPFYGARITEETRSGALAWLRKEGHDGLIKHEFTVNLGRGEDVEGDLNDLEALCETLGVAYKTTETVHPQTLTAFVREQTEKSRPVPADLFNVYVGMTTKLTDAK